jgi:hypothetical protein
MVIIYVSVCVKYLSRLEWQSMATSFSCFLTAFALCRSAKDVDVKKACEHPTMTLLTGSTACNRMLEKFVQAI